MMDIDHFYKVFLWTPEGLTVEVVHGNLPPVVRNYLENGSFEAAAKALTRLTGLKCTVTCTSKYTTTL